MSPRYSAAILGCGDIGHAHAEGYRLNPEVDIVAVVDPLEVARRQFQLEYGVEHAYASVEEMLDARTPDIVSVCTWHLLHAPLTIAAARAGARAVICEKPMAIGMGEVDAMISACDGAGAKLVIGHQRRFTPGWEHAREHVAGGGIGDVQLARGSGSAGLLNVGTHIVDGLRFVLGDPRALWVMGALERDTDRFEREVAIEDRCLVLAALEGGAQLLVESDLRERSGPPGIWLRIEGSDGIVEASEGHARTLNASSGGWLDLVNREDVDRIGGRANGRLVAELLAWIEGGPEHRCSARIARDTTEILMASYESARRRRVVTLPLEEAGYPVALMIAEGSLAPGRPGAYDIRAFLRREGADEARYAQLRSTGMRHHEIMVRLEAERTEPRADGKPS